MDDSRTPPGESFANTSGAQLSDAAQPVIEQTRLTVEEQKSAGARAARTIANAVHRAADELQTQLPTAAGYVHDAASKLDEASTALETRSFDELTERLRHFASTQPAAFFGAAALAGIALARFFKSSAESMRH